MKVEILGAFTVSRGCRGILFVAVVAPSQILQMVEHITPIFSFIYLFYFMASVGPIMLVYMDMITCVFVRQVFLNIISDQNLFFIQKYSSVVWCVCLEVF